MDNRKTTIWMTILLYGPVLLLTSFYLYKVTFTIQMFFALLITIGLYNLMRLREYHKVHKKHLYGKIVLFSTVLCGTLFLIFFTTLSINDEVYYLKVDEQEYSTAFERYWYQERYLDIDSKLLFVYEGQQDDSLENFPNIYVYNLEEEFHLMESVIDTNGLEVEHLKKTHDVADPYDQRFYFYGHNEVDDIVYTEIYYFDFDPFEDDNDFDVALLTSLEGKYEVEFSNTEILLIEAVTYYIPDQEPVNNKKIYRLKDDLTLETVTNVSYEFNNLYFIYDTWYAAITNMEREIQFITLNDSYRLSGILIDEMYDYPDSVTNGFDNIIIEGERSNYIISLVDQEVTQFEDHEMIHYNGENMYIINGELHGYEFQKLSKYTYKDTNDHVYSNTRVYSHRNGAVSFENEKMVMLNDIGREPTIFIKGPMRFIYPVLSLAAIQGLLVIGVREPKKAYLVKDMYQVKKLTCKKCGADNNIITFPDNCDYCGGHEFKQKI